MNTSLSGSSTRGHNRRPLYASRVYDRILTQIVRGTLGPGERVVERALAKSLDVSRTPVREAVLRLQQEGFLIPSGDAEKIQLIVAPLRRESALRLSHLVGVLEGLAARSAASAPPKERSAMVAELTKDLAEFRKQLQSGKSSFLRLYQIDVRFHGRFSDDYADDHLYKMLAVVRPHLGRYTWAYGTSQEVPWQLYRDEHAPIIHAIREGDPDSAEKSVRANWNNVGQRFYAARLRRPDGETSLAE
ncbi:MAG TPA: GntR family transcriptional regulator [Gemmatimonadaceae bacterium]|nr:GntR family transcriptional regulator [Gemmatimonadaceae bacterium]